VKDDLENKDEINWLHANY